MEAVMIASGFDKSPFIFKGSALYQIHLVKAKTIRPFIPKELRVVETFGYTFGGFYLAHYENSSFGAFDEMVVIAGIVRSDRSSVGAWPCKVLVSNDEVRDHARKVFGVPSQVAIFPKIKAMCPQTHERKPSGFLNINGLGNSNWPKNYEDMLIREIKDKGATDSCNISIKTAAAPDLDFSRFIISPKMKLSLPCLSGLTEYIPELLEYTCQLQTRVRVVKAAKVSDQWASDHESSEFQSIYNQMDSADMRKVVTRIVLQSKPFVAFEFNSLKMIVDSPTMVFQR